ncbi:TrkH family potassium uptake protein [Persicirhabdus sediminis]|uniref:TrkH family potassium uptake protein n=1 Tax=Persicirhabdus sediminis TaxID=454144 RepID=A0A8J7MBB0_9BACT|nr:TrkH family potassium uptake protein [Persicirhabdus sediminis]MBK1789957.1 TrkH family potassium uptake protein [Persicirhabdus sediminis]
MNLKILAKTLGALILLEAMAMIICGLFAYFDTVAGDEGAMAALFMSAGICIMGGIVLMLFGVGKIKRIPRREGIVIVGLGWLICGTLGGMPYMICEPGMPASDAFFESLSGFTTTGSSVMTDIESWPRGILLWRSMTQWLGGMGILVLFVAVLSYLGMGSKSLFRNESSFQTSEASTARIRDTAMTLWTVYLVITAVCLVGLKLMGLSWFNAVCHSFTVVSTGGFSPHNASIAYYSDWGNGWLIELWLSLFMVICSISFLIWGVILSHRWKRLRDEEEGKWFVIICLFSAVLIAAGLVIRDGSNFLDALRGTWFTVVSITSTTGFGLVDYEPWPAYALMILAMLMLMGGCSGSTAGGLKLSRLLVFLKTARFEVVRAFRPYQVFRMHVNGNALGEQQRSQTVMFTALYAFVTIFSCFVVALLEAYQGIDMLTCFGAVVATLANIGPGFGDVGPTENFAHLGPATKVFLGLLMVLGRLELFAILVLFIPSLWRKY